MIQNKYNLEVFKLSICSIYAYLCYSLEILSTKSIRMHKTHTDILYDITSYIDKLRAQFLFVLVAYSISDKESKMIETLL